MASSDDEAETLPETVSTYYFEDHDDEPVSFSVLPVRWGDGEGGEDDAAETIFLHGTADNGLRKIYREVKSWRFDLGRSRPEVSVLSKDNICFKLDKPRRSFQDTIRTVLITLHCLHYAKNHPDASREALWEHLAKTLGFYEVRPSAKDLQDHVVLIKEAIGRDDVLAKSKVLSKLMEEKPRKRSKSGENVAMPSFIVDDTEDVEDGTAEEDDCFDSVCALCDNGGDLLCCDGKCMRSFHATKEAGEESLCDSLGYSQHEVDAMQTFNCENCIHNLHQCFACGKLGSSDKSSGADVFQCVSATCGLFYHPHCVAKLVHRRDEVAAEDLKLRIVAGESFTCPMHKCCVCNQIENKKELDLQFAVCRRCPKSYHRKCLPKEIVFEDDDEDEDEDAITRAWEGLLPNRVLIYCLKHDIDEEIGTPVRNHIKFPSTTIRANRAAVGEKRKRPVLGSLSTGGKGLKKKRVASEDSSKRASENQSLGKGKSPFTKKEGEKDKKVRVSSGQEIAKKVKVTDASKKFHKDTAKSRPLEPSTSFTMREHTSLGERLYSFTTEASEQTKTGEPVGPDSEERRAVELASTKSDDSLHPLDADTERRLLNLVKEAASSVSMADVVRKQNVPSTHAQYLKSTVDKTITIGKVEGSVQALRAALQRLEQGDSNEDAKAVCDPEVLTQIFKWKDKLRVYLAPFIYGMRYTSFGRHFTKVDKLQEIVDKLHWYVGDGDMIVDFCCGANDFSRLMAKKLEETGKKCSYKNYDIFPPKNNFEFELRDWMTVQLKELPYGSKLIMGLNPPFGVRGALANKFIDKALQFKPKLLMLIVPSETERLDEKKFRYDLVWEDDRFLSGKSFYLPGSVDVKDKQIEQWNNRPPLLYLWSRRDWTAKHRTIAQKQGHLPTKSRLPWSNEDCNGSLDLHYLNDDRSLSLTSDTSMPMGRPEETKDRVNMAEGQKGRFSRNDSGRESWESQSTGTSKGKAIGIGTSGREIHGKSPAKETPHHPSPKLTDGKLAFYNRSSKQKTNGSRTSGREIDEKDLTNVESSFNDRSSREKASGRGTSGREIDEEPPAKVTSRRPSPKSSVNDRSSISHGVPFENDVSGMNYQQADPRMSMSHAEDFYGSRGSTLSDDANRMYGLNNNRYYSTQRWSSGGGPLTNSGAQNLEGLHTARMRDTDNYRPNVSEPEERCWRDLERLSQVRLYGQQDPNVSQRNYMAGHDPRYSQPGALTSTYGLLGSIAESSQRMDMSAMQRYAPRLDELNPMRMNNVRPEAPVIRGNGYLDLNRGPQPGHGGDSFGFATGPRRPYSQQNTFGWLNE
ncbi:protein ENHANCED DOWNY MILDEW 2-like isoform X2 [Rhodamnia argentea]|uniref:Protein ENHANCED DOWNY MILDEW 2-like isoform X2 n=1 Tax=Rhodamnia argentea TaxID=178133 RepID=A0A8B8NDU9_9MYRT|nr:protein ENHANCED DOWNY MILDEW 2-like isoform X2 [Rhodamnia argentea]